MVGVGSFERGQLRPCGKIHPTDPGEVKMRYFKRAHTGSGKNGSDSDMQWLHALLDFRKLFDRLWANMGHVFHLIRIGVCRKIQPTNPAWSAAILTSGRLVKVDDNLLLCPKSEVYPHSRDQFNIVTYSSLSYDQETLDTGMHNFGQTLMKTWAMKRYNSSQHPQRNRKKRMH